MSEENEKQKLQVDVKVDESDELQRLREEKEDLEAKLQMIAEKAFSEKKKSVGCDDDSIDTPEKLEAWQSGKQSTRVQKRCAT